MLRLLIVRHGETAWNRRGRYQGCRNTTLSTRGERQAADLGRHLAGVALAAVYTSPLRRAHATALQIARWQSCSVTRDAGLREICHGRWEGLHAEEVSRRFPRLWRAWKERPQSVRMPGGESLDDVGARVTAVLQRLRRRYATGTVCLVTHGVTARVLIARALGRTLGGVWSLPCSSGGVTELALVGGRYRLIRLDDVRHLTEKPEIHAAL